MEVLIAVIAGIGLSAACGFRVFIPLLLASIGVHSGHLSVGSSFNWLGSDWALICLGVATVVEITAYYVPWLDHALDTVATPAAVVAGSLLTMSQLQGVSGGTNQGLTWIMSVVMGGGVALFVQLATVLLRIASTATTGGVGNSVLSTGEHALSAIFALLAILIPIFLIAAFAGLIAWYIHRRTKGRKPAMNVRTSSPGGRVLVPNYARV